MNKVVKIAVALCVVVGVAFFASKKNLFENAVQEGENTLTIKRSDLSFSKNRLSFSPGERVSFTLFNGLSDQEVVFYLLKEGEDPTLVQHIKAQQGELPQEYFYYKAEKASPKSEVQIDFTAPEKEGDYYFVGIGDMPMDTLYGKLSIQNSQELKTEVQ